LLVVDAPLIILYHFIAIAVVVVVVAINDAPSLFVTMSWSLRHGELLAVVVVVVVAIAPWTGSRGGDGGGRGGGGGSGIIGSCIVQHCTANGSAVVLLLLFRLIVCHWHWGRSRNCSCLIAFDVAGGFHVDYDVVDGIGRRFLLLHRHRCGIGIGCFRLDGGGGVAAHQRNNGRLR